VRRLLRIGAGLVAVGAIVAIAVSGAGSKTLRAAPAGVRTATVPHVNLPPTAGVACSVASSSASVCAAGPCTVYVQSAPPPTVPGLTPGANCTTRARTHSRAVPISAPLAGQAVTRTAGP
jgi:hypothetical protein